LPLEAPPLAGGEDVTKKLIGDILSYPELSGSEISLMDIDKGRLDLIVQLAQKMVKDKEWKARITSALDRRETLKNADYVIVTVEVGGFDAYLNDIKIPDKYGINQNIGDTIGLGGVFRAFRTIPVLLDICKDMEEFCPDAYLLNYTNSTTMNCWAMNKMSNIKKVGLCHSTYDTAKQLASYMQIPYGKLSYWVAGINHMAWFLKLKWKGKNVYPVLRKRIKENPELWDVLGEYGGVKLKDEVRFQIFKHFNYFVTESPFHMSEYVPYFRKNEKQIKKLGIFHRWWLNYKRAPDIYVKELKDQIAWRKEIKIEKSGEYASQIIYSLWTGKLCRINGNVENKGLITNLPDGCCVEVPCFVDKSGIHPCYVGNLSPQCAALNRTNINV